MLNPLLWQSANPHPDNLDNFQIISQWWQDLNLKEVFWQQRLIPDTGSLEDINWEQQGFDEKFSIQMPQIRGITLYWHKSTFADERSMTPKQLILDREREQLDIYPQSQASLVIRVTKPHLVYQKFELKNPLLVGKKAESEYILLIRDKEQQIEVKINLSPENYRQFLETMTEDK
ncbi:hypothetical protein myaer87_26560 [Microcystis aeruginosa NIES-87]|uniref:hypothetical protein n=1 Tax=Microcystis sp. M169S2 TaxID=2771157 RepID=UPI000CAA72A6|nr:hypothetical protein [Microcystis sp. M169S2]MCA2719556.1 hypothetical protein [Microcystis sp. M169S2]GBE75429.1 hypothetical protein myaer87_26560 [Microcystis aeruginosa NIES-87]